MRFNKGPGLFLLLTAHHKQLIYNDLGNVVAFAVLVIPGAVSQFAFNGDFLAFCKILLTGFGQPSPYYQLVPLGLFYFLTFLVSILIIGGQ